MKTARLLESHSKQSAANINGTFKSIDEFSSRYRRRNDSLIYRSIPGHDFNDIISTLKPSNISQAAAKNCSRWSFNLRHTQNWWLNCTVTFGFGLKYRKNRWLLREWMPPKWARTRIDECVLSTSLFLGSSATDMLQTSERCNVMECRSGFIRLNGFMIRQVLNKTLFVRKVH